MEFKKEEIEFTKNDIQIIENIKKSQTCDNILQYQLFTFLKLRIIKKIGKVSYNGDNNYNDFHLLRNKLRYLITGGKTKSKYTLEKAYNFNFILKDFIKLIVESAEISQPVGDNPIYYKLDEDDEGNFYFKPTTGNKIRPLGDLYDRNIKILQVFDIFNITINKQTRTFQYIPTPIDLSTFYIGFYNFFKKIPDFDIQILFVLSTSNRRESIINLKKSYPEYYMPVFIDSLGNLVDEDKLYEYFIRCLELAAKLNEDDTKKFYNYFNIPNQQPILDPQAQLNSFREIVGNYDMYGREIQIPDKDILNKYIMNIVDNIILEQLAIEQEENIRQKDERLEEVDRQTEKKLKEIEQLQEPDIITNQPVLITENVDPFSGPGMKKAAEQIDKKIILDERGKEIKKIIDESQDREKQIENKYKNIKNEINKNLLLSEDFYNIESLEAVDINIDINYLINESFILFIKNITAIITSSVGIYFTGTVAYNIIAKITDAMLYLNYKTFAINYYVLSSFGSIILYIITDPDSQNIYEDTENYGDMVINLPSLSSAMKYVIDTSMQYIYLTAGSPGDPSGSPTPTPQTPSITRSPTPTPTKKYNINENIEEDINNNTDKELLNEFKNSNINPYNYTPTFQNLQNTNDIYLFFVNLINKNSIIELYNLGVSLGYSSFTTVITIINFVFYPISAILGNNITVVLKIILLTYITQYINSILYNTGLIPELVYDKVNNFTKYITDPTEAVANMGIGLSNFITNNMSLVVGGVVVISSLYYINKYK